MYYKRASQNLNNDYYNTYVKESTRGNETNDILTTIIKILTIVFLLTLIIFGYVFVSNQYYLSQVEAQKLQTDNIYIESDTSENSVEKRTEGINQVEKKLTSKDIGKIVDMVVRQLNKGKMEKSTIQTPKKEDKIDIKRRNHSNATDITIDMVQENNAKSIGKVIIVKEGDTLSTIASKTYGKVSDYKKIYQANPKVIKNENEIFIGQKLRIP